MYIEKVANFDVAMATLGHNIDPSLDVRVTYLKFVFNNIKNKMFKKYNKQNLRKYIYICIFNMRAIFVFVYFFI
jgi:hypothetical protein